MIPKKNKIQINYWLLKSEPDVFSIEDLESMPNKTSPWDGVRNYQARNTLRDLIKINDLVFFYHSNTEIPAIVGIAEVVREGYPDFTAFDKSHPYFDPKSKPEQPTWYMVDVKHIETFKQAISLNELRKVTELGNMLLLQKGSRLSVQAVTKKEWDTIITLVKSKQLS